MKTITRSLNTQWTSAKLLKNSMKEAIKHWEILRFDLFLVLCPLFPQAHNRKAILFRNLETNTLLIFGLNDVNSHVRFLGTWVKECNLYLQTQFFPYKWWLLELGYSFFLSVFSLWEKGGNQLFFLGTLTSFEILILMCLLLLLFFYNKKLKP